jgi:hypothetical protein
MPVALDPKTWRPIFANLRSLTIRLTLDCWYLRPEDVDEVITRDRLVDDRRSYLLQSVMSFYDSHLPKSLPVRRQVKCGPDQHRYDHHRQCTKTNETCAAFREYVEMLWSGDF